MGKEPEIGYGLVMAKRILEQQRCEPLRFAELIRILKKENPEDRETRDKVLYWLDVFKDYSIISFDRNEKGIKVYKVDDEELLRTLEEGYQRMTKPELKTRLSDIIGEIKDN